MQGKRGELQDEDRVAVKRMYDFLFAVAKESGIQVIVLDHAYLDVPEFKRALVEEPWRDGRALIPESWYEAE